MKRRAFTLIELITVIAISAVLLTIIAVPMIQSFNLTRAGQAFADAQNRARILIDQIGREVSNAASVRDNTGPKGAVAIDIPTLANQDPASNVYTRVLLPNSRIDILAPAQGDPTPAAGGGLVNPDTGKIDPTLRTPKGDINLPVTSSFRLVRYFVGLNTPISGTAANPQPGRYNNPYDGILMRRNGLKDNLFVLYRAEVNLREFDTTAGAWVLNRALFDLDGNNTVTPAEMETALDDPNFFVIDGTATLAVRQAQARRINQWKSRSRIITEFSRYDMLQPIFDKSSRIVTRDAGVPRVISLIQFTPSRVSNEPLSGALAVRSGEEAINSAKLGPDVYSTTAGNISSPFIRVRPSAARDSGGTLVNPWSVYSPWLTTNPYLVARDRFQAGNIVGFSLYHFVSGDDTTGGTEVFDIDGYERAAAWDPLAPLPAGEPALFRFPFSYAVDQAATRAGGTNLLNNRQIQEDFIPILLNEKEGKITASFPITHVGGGPNPIPVGNDNRPVAAVGGIFTPTNDPASSSVGSNSRWTQAAFSPSSATSTINQRFNVLWQDWNFLAPGLERAQYCRRFLDLRFTPLADGSVSPLNPSAGFLRARITPGSEVVIGPDQLPGANYGRSTRYTRVTTPGTVGPNQYYINYVNGPEPMDTTTMQSNFITMQADGTLTDPNAPTNAELADPTFYRANSFISAVLQPQFRAGYIEFNSRPGEPLPAGNISVFYRFQFTEPNDVLELDYDSRQRMNIGMTIRNFPQTTLPNVQNVTVKGQATVRNFLR